ncbi:MAG: hypothetical protein Q7T49_01685 [bacterium]|nr:hypothetical protein [bacterium]
MKRKVGKVLDVTYRDLPGPLWESISRVRWVGVKTIAESVIALAVLVRDNQLYCELEIVKDADTDHEEGVIVVFNEKVSPLFIPEEIMVQARDFSRYGIDEVFHILGGEIAKHLAGFIEVVIDHHGIEDEAGVYIKLAPESYIQGECDLAKLEELYPREYD